MKEVQSFNETFNTGLELNSIQKYILKKLHDIYKTFKVETFIAQQ